MLRCNWMKNGRLRVKVEAALACSPHPEGKRGLSELTVSLGLFTRQFFQIGFNLADLIGYY